MSALPPPNSSFTIRLFGPFDVKMDGRPLPRLHTRKGQWLLALLVLRQEHEISWDWLAETLWPESSHEAGLNNLTVSLSDLRQQLGPLAGRLVSPTHSTLRLNLNAGEADVMVFDEAVQREDEESLQRAVSLYSGPLLEGCTEDWVIQEREEREGRYLDALERLALKAMERDDPTTAIGFLRRAVACNPLREGAQRSLMQTLAANKDFHAANLVYRDFRLHLHDEFNVTPSPETMAVIGQIRAEARSRAPGRPLRSAGTFTPASSHSEVTLDHMVGLEQEGATLTFLLTDIEGSTRLWRDHSHTMSRALERHDAIADAIITKYHGAKKSSRGEGDSLFAVFASPTEAVTAAIQLQIAFVSEPWPAETPVRVRIALHTGEAHLRDGDFYGTTVNRCARLRAITHGQQVLLSAATQALVSSDLPEGVRLKDLGEHSLRDLGTERVFQVQHPLLPDDFSLAPVRLTNLPQELTHFIGREKELAEVTRLLSTTRLLTLTGIGGCGKTRLALQVAANALMFDQEQYGDGVWLVELDTVSDASLLPEKIANALGAPDDPQRPVMSRLRDYLRTKSLLLVLDNCESWVEPCRRVMIDLLKTCPHLRILATSRQHLNLAACGELVWRVPSMALPPNLNRLPRDATDLVALLREYDAVRLFVERASMHTPGFALTERNVASVVPICQCLDGIPLALELAAARIRALPIDKIAARLDDRFRFLKEEEGFRQRTLRAAIDWSYDLLGELERRLMGRLSVFAGGWSLEAAEAVCAGGVIELQEVAALLSSLVDHSLVVYEGDEGQERYRFLETIRQYASEKMAESEGENGPQERHFHYFSGLAREAKAQGRGPQEKEVFDLLEREQANLLTALKWEGSNAEACLQMAGALWYFWYQRGYLSEGRARLESALVRQGADAPTAERAIALQGAGTLAWRQGDFQKAKERLEESLAISTQLHDTPVMGNTLHNLGILSYSQGDYEIARERFEECLAIFAALEDEGGIADATVWLGNIARAQRDYAEAQRCYESSLDIYQELEPEPLMKVASVLHNLGVIAHEQSDYELARTYYEESLALKREVNNARGIAITRQNLGNIDRALGNYESANANLHESLIVFQEQEDQENIAGCQVNFGMLAIYQDRLKEARDYLEKGLKSYKELGDTVGIAAALAGFGHLAFAQEQPERAVRLLSAALSLCATLPPNEQKEHLAKLELARSTLSEEAFAAAKMEGVAMTKEESIKYARDKKVIRPSDKSVLLHAV